MGKPEREFNQELKVQHRRAKFYALAGAHTIGMLAAALILTYLWLGGNSLFDWHTYVKGFCLGLAVRLSVRQCLEEQAAAPTQSLYDWLFLRLRAASARTRRPV